MRSCNSIWSVTATVISIWTDRYPLVPAISAFERNDQCVDPVNAAVLCAILYLWGAKGLALGWLDQLGIVSVTDADGLHRLSC